jgi:hypothetical protein
MLIRNRAIFYEVFNINGLWLPVLVFSVVCPLRDSAWRYGYIKTKLDELYARTKEP